MMTRLTELYDLTEDMLDLGGPGSGNWGHAGRPGKIGGSAPRTGGGGGEKVVHGSFTPRQMALKDERQRERDAGVPPWEVQGVGAEGLPSTRELVPPPNTENMPEGYRAGQSLELSDVDLSPWAEPDGTFKWSHAYKDRNGQLTNDAILEEINHQQGFDGLPGVVSKQAMDEMINNGAIELFRGLSAETPEQWHEYREQFARGKFFIGNGNFGNGMYASPDADYASEYVRGSQGGLLRMALPKNARIVDWDDLPLPNNTPRGATPQQWLTADVGRLGALVGADAIRISTKYTLLANTPIEQYIILNRTALFVQDSD